MLKAARRLTRAELVLNAPTKETSQGDESFSSQRSVEAPAAAPAAQDAAP